MKALLKEINYWYEQGYRCMLATIVKTEGSSPREIGATMAIRNDGQVAGSISGGCIEAAVIEEALIIINDNSDEQKSKLIAYGGVDEFGWDVGLTCGGSIWVFLEVIEPSILEALNQLTDEPFAICTRIDKNNSGKILITSQGIVSGSLDSSKLEKLILEKVLDLPDWDLVGLQNHQGLEVFIQCFACPPHLIIFGAVDFTRSLCKIAKMLNYRITICDSRSKLLTPERFPEADVIIVGSPSKYIKEAQIDSRTAIAVLTHDPKFDVPILLAAIDTNAGYIGAMGSRKATSARIERLKDAGLNQQQIAQIKAPIGLDIGASNPDETAISIMAEIIANKNNRQGSPLSSSFGSIRPRSIEKIHAR